MIALNLLAASNKLLRRSGIVCRFCRHYSGKLSADKAEEIKIPVPWGHISGKWWGDKNQVPTIAIHGWQDNANSFDRLIPLLNLSSVLALDLPGHGYSSHLPSGKTYDIQDMLILLHDIITEKKWTNVSFLTHSFGGSLGFTYSSLFSDNIKYLINCDCARTLLSLYRYVTSQTFSKGVDSMLKIEKQKNEIESPAYKLSDMIRMTIEGSVGSVATPEAAMLLLKRGAVLVDQKFGKTNQTRSSSTSDLKDLMEYERKAAETLSESERNELQKYYANIIERVQEARNNLKSFKLSEEEDKFYKFTRDPSIKVKTFLSTSNEYILEASKNLKCPMLSLRAKNGFLYGSGRKVYEESLDILKKTSKYFEHHDVSGTHHAHLNNPELLAPIINRFLEKVNAITA